MPPPRVGRGGYIEVRAVERHNRQRMRFAVEGKPPLTALEHVRAPWLLLEAAEAERRSPVTTVVRHAAVCVVLAVAVLEGYINSFADRHIDRWLWKLIDREHAYLGLRKKWHVAPRLAGADREFPKDTRTWERFCNLTKLRNDTVHWGPPEAEAASARRAWGQWRRTVDTFTAACPAQACRTACEMIWELHQVHGSSLLPGWDELLARVEGPWHEGPA